MSKDRVLVNYLKSVLEKDMTLNEPEVVRAVDILAKAQHALAVNNPKLAQRQLNEFVRKLIELLRD